MPEQINIIYLRVSTKDKDQDPKQQLNAITGKFDIKSYTEFLDIGSAYNLELISKRIKFLELLDICFDASKTTIMDLFLGKYHKRHVNLYVWDYSRIIREIEFNVLFSILASKYSVSIYSYKDKDILKAVPNETPSSKFIRMMMNNIVAYSAEEYSYVISQNTQKAYSDGYSSRGKKWGKGYHKPDGSKVSVTRQEEDNLKKDIAKLLKDYERKDVIEIVKERYDIALTHSWLSRNFRKVN